MPKSSGMPMRAMRTMLAAVTVATFTACHNDPAGPGGGGDGLTHPAGELDAQRMVGARPYAVAIGPDGRALVGQLDNGQLLTAVLPATSFADAIPAGSTPTDIALDAAGDRAFVANQYDDAIQVLNPANGQTVGSVHVTGDPFSVIPDASGATIYVTTNANAVYKLAVGSGSLLGQLGTDNATAQSLAFSPTSGLLYVSTRDGGTVMEVDPATMTANRDFHIGGRTQEVAVSADGAELWVANETGFVSVVNLGTGNSVDIPVAGMAWGLAISPDQKQVWVGLLDRGIVKVIDRATKAVTKSIFVDGVPRRIRFSPTGDRAVVANESGYITVLK